MNHSFILILCLYELDPCDDEHQYDYAFAEENDMSNRRRQNQNAGLQGAGQTRVVQTVMNPYYAGDDTEMETNCQAKVAEGLENTGYEGDGDENGSGSEPQPGPSNVVTVKVAENPYYQA